ncbi:dihydropteroate synthase [Corynebacterium resistens DSM 45100]|uniref:Dihydropteroate synthase n=1 Tax=Corynebacterium resistens (strain DSM 45100 / JCM 12819 / GTC 2026 / SICGH 158) TaxID=662755 RepID=F8E1Z3_CORRG|nr:dihydropteroate synthase [Corynebacterium resistens]AEI08547.1 dihydropteroate synthase [Corynebacterium resistens DSM 45100]
MSDAPLPPPTPSFGANGSPTKVMGILNVTEDSFSDGGSNPDTATAVRNAKAMLTAGADIIDIGGESTRPGATRVSAEVEAARVVSVVRELVQLTHEPRTKPFTTSIDTMRASTARVALEAGATFINDVSGGLADPEMLSVCADFDCPVILMHWEKDWGSASAQVGAEGYRDHGVDIVTEVSNWLLARVEEAEKRGVDRKRIYLDPGIGFAKSPRDNWQLLHGLNRIVDLGFPVLVGASRKRFLTALRPGPDGNPGTPESADDATAAVTSLAALAGAWAVRVHNVAPSKAAVDVIHAVRTGDGPQVAEDWRAKRG